MSAANEMLLAIEPVVAAFEHLGVAYCVCGSVASSAHGIARSTVDADLVADLPEGQVRALVAALERDYYIDEDAARDAVRRRSMFNVIHLQTMIKVDVYVLTQRAFDRTSFDRRVSRSLTTDSDRVFAVDSAEDTILHKLEWYREGGGVSERQWNDVLGVMRVQAGALDDAYLDRWAALLALDELLARARREAA